MSSRNGWYLESPCVPDVNVRVERNRNARFVNKDECWLWSGVLDMNFVGFVKSCQSKSSSNRFFVSKMHSEKHNTLKNNAK